MTPSLRGQLAASAALLGLVTLVTASALIVVTSWMGRDIEQVWEASSQARHWLRQAGSHVGGAPEASLLEAVRREVEAYFTRERAGAGAPSAPGSPDPSLGPILELTERLVSLNVTDAQKRLVEARAWDRRANILGSLAVLVLLSGIGGVLWAERRLVHRPVKVLREALVSFRLGSSWTPAPEVGAAELRDIARAFNEMVARLERQREAQVSFLAGVAHDLRNPLQALKLATTRVEAGHLELRLGEHDVVGLVREAVELHHSMSPRHSLELQVPEHPAPVCCDATRISQVLNNLLSNAIKYSPQGGTVHIRVAPSEDGYRISVTDSGAGIPPAEKESIFEPFRRSSSTRGVIPGVGLGLAVARKILTAHGGSLEVESEPGRGATFYMKLPATRGATGSKSS